MKFAVVVLCLLGAAAANPILHKVAMEIMEHASNSTSSASESSEQSETSEKDSSPENTSENDTSESSESMSNDRTSDMSHSHSLEDRFGTGEPGMTTDNSQGSLENIRKGWVRLVTVKLVSEEDTKPDEDGSHTKSVESTENKEKQTHSSSSSSSSSTSGEDRSRPVVDSSETSESKNSNSSSSSNESQESSQESTESAESRSKECQPGVDSDECDSDEYNFQDIGDNGARDPFNGFHTPDNNEHGLVFKR